MDIRLGGFVTFIAAIVVVLKVLDWYLLEEQKLSLRSYIKELLEAGSISASSMVKAPLAVYSKTLDMVLGRDVFSKIALKRSAGLAAAILIASASITGLLTDTFLGVSTAPWDAYDQEISKLKQSISAARNDVSDYGGADLEKADRYYTSLENLLSNAQKPAWKMMCIIGFLTISFLITIVMTMLSIGFSRKVVRELLKTESLLLIVGALLLGMVVSSLFFTLITVLLFTLTSGFLLHVSSFASIVLAQPSLVGVGVVAGYASLALYMSPMWIKAAAVGAIVPGILLVVTGSASGAIYPFRHMLGSATSNLIARALESKNGALAFFATGMTLLAAAITLAVNMFVV